jgi:hypothetical protein
MNDDNILNDTEVEARLVLAGTVWRSGEPLPPEPNLARMTRPPHRRVLLVSAAAAAAALVAAGAAALLSPGPGGVVTGEHPDPERLRSLDQVAVHNGSHVRATGTIIAERGKPVILCLGALFGGSPDHPTCPAGQGIRLTGADVDSHAAVHTGRAVVTGTWRNRTIAVTSTGEQPDSSSRPPLPPLRPPCAAPAGGWHSGPLADRTELDAYLAAHPDRFGGTDIAFPDGRPGGPTGANGYTDVAQVVVVEVATGDLDAARADLAARYRGNLCVERTAYSTTQLNGAAAKVERLLRANPGPIITFGHAGPKRVFVYLSVVDDALYRKLAAIEDTYGIGILEISADVEPIR